MQGGQFSQVSSADYTTTGNTQHFRLSITGAAALLSTYITGGLPMWAVSKTETRSPSAVLLSQEAASSGSVYVTWDGQTTPLANGQLGFAIPTAPNFMRIPGRDVLKVLKIIASGTTQYVQAYFEP